MRRAVWDLLSEQREGGLDLIEMALAASAVKEGEPHRLWIRLRLGTNELKPEATFAPHAGSLIQGCYLVLDATEVVDRLGRRVEESQPTFMVAGAEA